MLLQFRNLRLRSESLSVTIEAVRPELYLLGNVQRNGHDLGNAVLASDRLCREEYFPSFLLTRDRARTRIVNEAILRIGENA